jgi:site-specific DNA-methyltransferase (adenine-specific)
MINSVLQGDCLELMRDIPDKSIDMILCDLPYGTTACKWDVIIPFDLLWAQYKRIVKPNAAIALTASQPFTSQLVMSNIKWFKYCWVWRKGRFANQLLAKIQPLKTHEDIIIFSEKTTKYNPQGLMKVSKLTRQGGRVTDCNGGGSRRKQYLQEFSNYPRSILEFASEGCTVHPTQKPVALFEYLIKTYTNEGDLILDNCAGSGTTAVAAINTNRNYILMEKEAKYIDVINQRLGNHEPSPVLTFPPQPQQLSLFA